MVHTAERSVSARRNRFRLPEASAAAPSGGERSAARTIETDTAMPQKILLPPATWFVK